VSDENEPASEPAKEPKTKKEKKPVNVAAIVSVSNDGIGLGKTHDGPGLARAGPNVGGDLARNAIALARSKKAWELRLSGKTYEEIAEIIGVAQSTVAQYVLARLKRVDEEMRLELPSIRVQELMRVEKLYAVAYAFATGGPMLDHNGEPRRDDKGEIIYCVPDHRWMRQASTLADMRQRLLGLDVKRSTVEVNVNGTVTHTPTKLREMSPTEIAMLEHLHGKAGAKSLTSSSNEVVDAEYEEKTPLVHARDDDDK